MPVWREWVSAAQSALGRLRRGRRVGLVLLLVGTLVLATALIGPATSNPQPSTTTSAAGQTSQTISTTTSTTTTSTTLPPETLAEFVDLFAAALEADDVQFIFGRLHPAVVDGYGADICLKFIEREIIALDNYRLTADPAPPADADFELPSGMVTIEAVVLASVAFTFGGEDFELPATFALVDGEYRWMTQCRESGG
jgi:hypothetical protein